MTVGSYNIVRFENVSNGKLIVRLDPETRITYSRSDILSPERHGDDYIFGMARLRHPILVTEVGNNTDTRKDIEEFFGL